MNLNNFTIKSQEALQQAQLLVQGNEQQQIETSTCSKRSLK
jgi:ATP-dependent Clp protease ATP-binding subunit ClpB